MSGLNKNKKKSDGVGMNVFKLLISIAIIVGGIIANYYYMHVAGAIRVAVGLVLCIASLIVFYTTIQGQVVWSFVKGSRAEMRKVTWPTRPETMQTLLIVVVMVFITALILWGFDSVSYWSVSWITGSRG